MNPRRVIAATLLARLLVVAIVALPAMHAAVAGLAPALNAQAWSDLASTPGVARAWVTSVATSLAATSIAALFAWALAARWLQPVGDAAHRHADVRRAQAWLGPMLAMPHAAFAIGLMLLLAPAGWLARVLAWPLGWSAPPQTGVLIDSPLALIVVLVLKELPFLLWNVLASMRRPDVQALLVATDRQAALLGHGPSRRWWLVHAPMHASRLAWPLLAVLGYGLAVVDVPLVTGPTLPPPLAVQSWQDIVDPDPARQAAGAAGAWLLAGTLLAVGAGFSVLAPSIGRALAAWAARGVADVGATGGADHPHASTPRTARLARGRAGWITVVTAYAAVGLALLVASFSGPWPFPSLLPQAWTTGAWVLAFEGAPRIGYSFAMAAAAACAGVALAATWLAATPRSWDRLAIVVAMATVLLPSLLVSLGFYNLALRLRLDATHLGLLWSHLLFACAYALLVLAGPWRGLDRRWFDTAKLLGHGPWSRLTRVRLPLLRAPLAAAWAVAFAVSIAQFLPTQLVGAGRLTTLATETVTLAASGQRSTAAATALVLALLPCAVFVIVASGRTEPRGSDA